MVYVPVTILGGLPVIASVWFSGPDYYGEYDAGCDNLYWQRADGSRGKEVSKKIYDRCEKYDSFWQSMVTEQANDWLGCNCPTRYSNGEEEGDWSEEYILLNGNPKEKVS